MKKTTFHWAAAAILSLFLVLTCVVGAELDFRFTSLIHFAGTREYRFPPSSSFVIRYLHQPYGHQLTQLLTCLWMALLICCILYVPRSTSPAERMSRFLLLITGFLLLLLVVTFVMIEAAIGPLLPAAYTSGGLTEDPRTDALLMRRPVCGPYLDALFFVLVLGTAAVTLRFLATRRSCGATGSPGK